MSDISFEFPIEPSPAKAFHTIRKNLPEIIQTISIVNHTDRKSGSTDTAESIVDFWTIEVLSALPGILSKFVKLDDVKIRSESYWSENKTRIEFDLKTLNWTDLLENCEGEINFVKSGSRTLVKVNCDFTISLSQVPGLPNFLANRLTDSLNSLAEKKVKNFISEIQSGINEASRSNHDNNQRVATNE